jgi:coatomer subunit beta
MFKTSLYISNSSDLSEDKIIELIESKDVLKKIEGMKNLITHISQGKTSESVIHTVVKEVLMMENNELKRLLYYFLELYAPLMNEGELLLLNNQIRKDLESPNEFIRGLTLKFVSTLRSEIILNNCYKSIKENTTHSVGYVRRSSYYCLGSINLKMGLFSDTPVLLFESLYKEMDPLCLAQAFFSLYMIDEKKALFYAQEVGNTKGKELSLLFIDKIDIESFLKQFVDDQDGEVRLESCIKLLGMENESFLLSKYVDVIFQDIKEHEEFFEVALESITKIKDNTDLSKHCIDALQFINPYNLDMSKSAIKFAFEVCKAKDFLQVLSFVVQKYSEIEKMNLKNRNMEIMILDELLEFISRFGIYNEDVKNICYRNLNSKNPGLAFSSLKLLSSILEKTQDREIVEVLVENLPKIMYGKILRFIFKIFIKFADKEHFKNIIDLIDNKFKEICQNKEESNFLIFEKEHRFLISFVCISLTEMYFNFESNEDLCAQIIALLLGLTKLENFCDLSTKSTLFLCIKSLSAGNKYSDYNIKKKTNLVKMDICEPLEIPFLKIKRNEQIDKLSRFLNSEETDESLNNVVQLTGLSDPIYVEANVIYNRYEVILDLLLINQTDNYLQNMLFDFGTSQNIRAVSLEMPENMKGRSALTKKLVFRILNSSNGFINGSVTFKYPNESGEYANQNFTLNFSEIKTDVSDFLEIKSFHPEEFKILWKKMEWENVYSIKVLSSFGLRNVFNMFNKCVKGTVVDYKENEDILVANISSTTRQNNDIFFNVCMAKNENFINLECRIRSSKEDIVKSMSNILGRVVKEVRIK